MGGGKKRAHITQALLRLPMNLLQPPPRLSRPHRRLKLVFKRLPLPLPPIRNDHRRRGERLDFGRLGGEGGREGSEVAEVESEGERVVSVHVGDDALGCEGSERGGS